MVNAPAKPKSKPAPLDVSENGRKWACGLKNSRNSFPGSGVTLYRSNHVILLQTLKGKKLQSGGIT